MFLIHILYYSRHRFLSVLHFKYPKFDDIEIERKQPCQLKLNWRRVKEIILFLQKSQEVKDQLETIIEGGAMEESLCCLALKMIGEILRC